MPRELVMQLKSSLEFLTRVCSIRVCVRVSM